MNTVSDFAVKEYIEYCKDFWKITNFKEEILDWNFKTKHPENKVFNIGHPKGSHKGDSIGDIIPYTRLPEIIKSVYPTSTVTVPNSFVPIFRNNPYVDDFNGPVVRWGSLGTFGTTVQRTCNVWGFKTFESSPKIYSTFDKQSTNTILFCINSKTGGRIKNLKLFETIIEHLKSKYYCVQLGLKDDELIRTANEHIFNYNNSQIIDLTSQFNIYIGSQNSIYHVAKGLGLEVIGILPENVSPDLVVLPMLTQINHLEIEMLDVSEITRCINWKQWMRSINRNPDDSHHIGWLYPDSTHLTERSIGTDRCPPLSIDNIDKSLNKKIYPYGDERLWKFNEYRNLWIGD